jgi:hypothetical protein
MLRQVKPRSKPRSKGALLWELGAEIRQLLVGLVFAAERMPEFSPAAMS